MTSRGCRSINVFLRTVELMLVVVSVFVISGAVGWPGTGVVSIYYDTNWTFPITVHYFTTTDSLSSSSGSDSSGEKNMTMLRWWGPEKDFEADNWKYVEIPANTISRLYFSNSSGAVDNRDGEYWSFEAPGIYALYGDSTNTSLAYYWPGCPGVPPTNVVVQCSAHGVCDYSTYECNCDPGWSCPACECYDGCRSQSSAIGVGKSNMTYSNIFSVGECCTKCSNAEQLCVAANYDHLAFSCQILHNLESVKELASPNPHTLLHSPTPTPAPSSGSESRDEGNDGGDSMDKTVFIVVGVASLILLIVGVLAVRLITNQQRQDEVMHLLAQQARTARSGGGVFEGKYKIVRLLGRGAFGVVYLVAKKPGAANTGNGGNPISPSHRPSSSAPRRAPPTPSNSPNQGQGSSNNLLYTPKPSQHALTPPSIQVQSSGTGSPHIPSSKLEAIHDPNLFAMKVIHCMSEEELSAAFSEFQSLRKLQGHENIIPVVDMFMTWEADLTGVVGERLGGGRSASARSLSEHTLNGAEGDTESDNDTVDSSVKPPSRYLCIVMEYMSEGTLEKAIQEDPLYVSQPHVIINLLRQILSGIAFSHRKNLIHRDLKPGNVLLTSQRTRAVLTDFGLARDLDSSATQLAGVGTLHFLAPEQIDHRVSKKSDVWSIACIAVAMIHAPVSIATRAMFLLRANPSFEADLRDDMRLMPKWLQDLLIRMLESVPIDRPSADECLAEMDFHSIPEFSRQPSEASFRMQSPSLQPLAPIVDPH